LTEELVGQIDDGFETGSLPDRYKLTIRLTDVVVNDPRSMTGELRAALLEEFSAGDIVELLLTTALASAFSKAAIAWGPPAAMPVLEVPTPRPDGSVT
jgi:alkylhydroperoxidase family enzyme